MMCAESPRLLIWRYSENMYRSPNVFLMETTVLIWNFHEAALRCVVLKSWINTSRYLSRPCGCAARARLLGSTAPAPRCVGPGRPTGHTGRGRRGKRQWCRFSAPRRQSLGVFGGCGCLTWCFQAWDCEIVWMHIPPNFCTCLCYNSRALLAAARRGFFRAPQMARKHSPEDTGRRIGDEKCKEYSVNCSWFSATFSLVYSWVIWYDGEALSKSPLCVAKEKETKLKLEERLGHMLAAFLRLGALNSTGNVVVYKAGAGWEVLFLIESLEHAIYLDIWIDMS